jgi:hypothetical protein
VIQVAVPGPGRPPQISLPPAAKPSPRCIAACAAKPFVTEAPQRVVLTAAGSVRVI